MCAHSGSCFLQEKVQEEQESITWESGMCLPNGLFACTLLINLVKAQILIPMAGPGLRAQLSNKFQMATMLLVPRSKETLWQALCEPQLAVPHCEYRTSLT